VQQQGHGRRRLHDLHPVQEPALDPVERVLVDGVVDLGVPGEFAEHLLGRGGRVEQPALELLEQRVGGELAPAAHRETVGQEVVEATARDTDRKSTRLNSSHVKISYAVFCLKKKKNI